MSVLDEYVYSPHLAISASYSCNSFLRLLASVGANSENLETVSKCIGQTLTLEEVCQHLSQLEQSVAKLNGGETLLRTVEKVSYAYKGSLILPINPNYQDALGLATQRLLSLVEDLAVRGVIFDGCFVADRTRDGSPDLDLWKLVSSRNARGLLKNHDATGIVDTLRKWYLGFLHGEDVVALRSLVTKHDDWEAAYRKEFVKIGTHLRPSVNASLTPEIALTEDELKFVKDAFHISLPHLGNNVRLRGILGPDDSIWWCWDNFDRDPVLAKSYFVDEIVGELWSTFTINPGGILSGIQRALEAFFPSTTHPRENEIVSNIIERMMFWDCIEVMKKGVKEDSEDLRHILAIRLILEKLSIRSAGKYAKLLATLDSVYAPYKNAIFSISEKAYNNIVKKWLEPVKHSPDSWWACRGLPLPSFVHQKMYKNPYQDYWYDDPWHYDPFSHKYGGG